MKRFWRLVLYAISIVGIALVLFYLAAWLVPLESFGDDNRIRIFDGEQKLMYESNHSRTSHWIAYDEIPESIIDGVVAVEDKSFFYHLGFDPLRIAKAMFVNVTSGSIQQGGSTITQQYAKNQYLTNEKTWKRKAKEAFLAAQLEMHYSKEQIMEGYLNTIYYGHGIYGIYDASYFYFGCAPDALNTAQIAMLIGIPNGPSYYSPYNDEQRAMAKQQSVLALMRENGALTEQQYRQAQQQELAIRVYSEQELSQNDLIGYYKDAVLQQAMDMGYLSKDSIHYSIDIYTYYEEDIQHLLTDIIRKETSDTEVQAAAIVMQPYTGHVLAIAGGTDYGTTEYNRALYSKRQIASTIKPLLYYLALQEGFTPSTTFLSKKTTFQISPTETYAPTNYMDVYADEPISLINAISLSDNIYAMKTHLYLGTAALCDALDSFGIIADDLASNALGTVSMPIYDLARIYNTFASEGLYVEPAMIRQIQDDDGDILYQNKEEAVQKLKKDETLILNQLLRAPFDIKNNNHLIATMLGYEPHVTTAVKSGTSDWDSIVVGFNPEYTIAVWNGYDDNRVMDSAEDRRIAKRIWKGMFNALYEGTDESPWYELNSRLEARKVDPITGELSVTGSWYWYKKSNLPSQLQESQSTQAQENDDEEAIVVDY